MCVRSGIAASAEISIYPYRCKETAMEPQRDERSFGIIASMGSNRSCLQKHGRPTGLGNRVVEELVNTA